jgi:hypothetical protein
VSSIEEATGSEGSAIGSLSSAFMNLETWLSRHAWLAIPFLALPALTPFLSLGLPYSHDGVNHLIRLAALDRLLHDGAMYPRWIPQLFVGLGYPLLNFYGPATYYLAEFLHLLGFGLLQAFSATLVVLLILGGFGMYRLAYDVFGGRRAWAALISATAYMYAPYLLTNLFVRGAIAELAAQALLPWVLWSYRRLIYSSEPIRYLLPAVLSLGILAITHTISLMFVPPLLLIYVLVLWWRNGRRRVAIRWLAAALALSAGVSAFFWLPVIGETRYLSGETYQIARALLSRFVWTWDSLLGRGFFYDYSGNAPGETPFRLGLVQLGLALAGLIVARRRDPEWLFFIAASLVAGLGISSLAVPLWTNAGILVAVQFPWRLLIVLSLLLALFSGGIVLRARPAWARAAVALAAIGLIIAADTPHIGWMPYFPAGDEALNWPEIAQFEGEGPYGTMFSRELNPLWEEGVSPDGRIMLAPEPDAQGGSFAVEARRAGPYGLEATVSSDEGGPLRFMTHYFPGWRVVVDRGSILPVYPSTNLGLLTVDLPAGAHELRLTWSGTAIQKFATAFSLLTLVGLAWFYWRHRSFRWMTGVPLALLVLGLALSAWFPRVAALEKPLDAVDLGDVQLLGYRIERGDPRRLYLYPLWYVRATPREFLPVRWQLRDAADQLVSETAGGWSYFNSLEASNWPPGTVVDDAYELALPPGLAPGTYSVQAEYQPAGSSSNTQRAVLGRVTIEDASPPRLKPDNQLNLELGGEVGLAGYDLDHNGRRVASTNRPLVVHPGDVLDYTLFWQALRPRPLERLYNGFVHLVDLPGEPLAKQDHRAGGSPLRPPPTWDIYYLQPDRYQLHVPESASNGLYWPLVGLYAIPNLELLPIQDADGQSLGNSYRLPPLKVVSSNPAPRPQHPVSARLGDIAILEGYDLLLPQNGLRPGSQFTLTLYYRSEAPTEVGYTQFVHLYDPDLGMAAQWDAPPRNGGNPTWSWAPGEVISDTAALRVADDVKPGSYVLQAGLYDPGDGARLPVWDRTGNPLANDAAVLMTLQIQGGDD